MHFHRIEMKRWLKRGEFSFFPEKKSWAVEAVLTERGRPPVSAPKPVFVPLKTWHVWAASYSTYFWLNAKSIVSFWMCCLWGPWSPGPGSRWGAGEAHSRGTGPECARRPQSLPRPWKIPTRKPCILPTPRPLHSTFNIPGLLSFLEA